MKKKFVRLISAVLSAAMTLTAVPLSAFAEGEAHTHDGESNVITAPLDFREKKADENGVGWSWVYGTKTLTLDGVNIQATTEENMMSVVTVPDGTEIVLNGNNTIVQTNTGDSDTYVLSAVNTNDVNCDGTMTISGDGVLNAENRSTDSMARSLGGSIILNGGTVNATGTVKTNSLEIHNDGKLNANATTASFEGVAVNVSGGITVDGNGSLTAVGCANESTLNSAILLTSNFDKISVSGNGSITVPESNKARVGIYYSGNNGDGMDAEISGGKVTAYGTKYGICKVNLIMSGTGSVYTTGGSYAIGQTVPTIDEDRFTVKGSTEFKASESAVTGEVKIPDGYYYIGEADAKTVVIKPDTEPSIKLGKQIGAIYADENGNASTAYFYITAKNFADGAFSPEAEWVTSPGSANIDANITKTGGEYVCEVICDEPDLSRQYELRVKSGEVYSNTVTVTVGKPHFALTSRDSQSKYYTNYNGEQKITLRYDVEAGYENQDGLQYNWSSDSKKYDIADLGTVNSEDGANEFVFADNVPEGSYVIYCDVVYNNDNGEAYTLTERFAFTFEECKHTGGFTDEVCNICHNACDHKNIDTDTGICVCGRQFVATISTDGSAPTGYGTLKDCLNSITADTGNYVKIYQDIEKDSSQKYIVKYHVTLDLNGHRLDDKLEINEKNSEDNNGELTLTGTGYIDNVYAYSNTTFTIDDNANIEADTFFNNAGTRFTVSDGANVTVRYLAVKESISSEGNATSVKLATGMKITEMLAYDRDISSPLSENIMLKNLLSDNQMLKYESSSKIIDLYYGASRIIINSELYGYGTITIVEHTDADHKYSSETGACKECGKPCEHGGDINTDTGICSICGAVVSVALYTDTNGISKYVDTDELHSLLNEYGKSGTVKLFKDYYKIEQHDIDGVITIDLNGHDFTVRGVTPWSGGKVTFKNSGSEQVTCSGSVSPTVDTPGGTLIVDGDIYFDSAININDYGTVILNAGKYVDLTIKGDRTLCDMLGEGKAFYNSDGTVFNAKVQAGSDLTVKAHSHTYVDGKCDCGYVCPHSNIDINTGKCTECEYQYAAVIVKDGAVAFVYKETEMEAAFQAADSGVNTGCTLRVYKNYTGSYTTLSGKFTLWIAEKANVGALTVSGDITVTGSEKSNRIYGDFNVAAGGKLTFDENCGAMGTVSVGAGTFDCYYSINITLNINDASSDVILHGGTFRKICYNGGGDRANAEILTLLAENRIFMKTYGELVDGSKTLLKDGFATTVGVIRHEDHGYDSTTGKCKICGKRCGHTDVDSKTGVCSVCEYQLTAGISGVGTAKYFDNIDNAFTAALSAENNGCTLTLYKDCELSQNIVIGNATVTVDMNGHSILLAYRIKVNDGGVLYLKNSRENGSIDTEIEVNKGGTLINGTADDSSSAVSVFSVYADAAKCVEIYGGSCTGLTVNNGTSGIALYGGSYELIHTNDLTDSTPVSALLAKGYAFAILNSVTHLPESIVDGSAVTLSEGIRNVTVVKHTDADHKYSSGTGKCDCGYVCPHSDVDSKTGVCSVCKYQLTAGISSAGTAKYFDNIDDAFTAALSEENNGCTLTLYKDCELSQNIVIGNATLTVDVNGHFISPEIRGIDVNDGGVLYLKNSGENGSIGLEMAVNKGGTLINGTADDSSSAVSLFAVTADAAECVEFYGGSCTYLTIKNGTSGIALYGGYYDIICGPLTDNTPVNDLLAKGYAFATLNSVTHLRESIVDGSAVTLSKGIRKVTVVKHTHTYTETNTKCACGAVLYAKVTSADGTTNEYFDSIEEGLLYADKAENKGCVFTLVTSGKINSGVTLSNGQFTITTSNYGTIYDYNQTITIDGADVIAEGYMFIRCKVNVKSGSLTLPEGSSAGFDSIAISGGTVTVSEGVNVDNTAGADNLFVSEDATDAKLTIGGGTYSNINLGQFKLKDVIASGVRVISYDNPTDPTAEKTAKALLYSDIAEKNNFDSENNTVSYYLFTKCEHKNEDGSYAFNEGGICKYCNSEFAASVSYTADGGEKTELFSDICDAFDKANGVGTATITLCRDIADSEIAHEINVTGNVTIALNGKTLGATDKAKKIYICGSTLTVNGNGKVWSAIEAKPDSKLTITNGEYYDVYALSDSEVVILDGIIDCLSVCGTGKAEVSGGKFKYLFMYNGKAIESVLADGYAYKNADGTWLSIDEREKDSYLGGSNGALSVEQAPIKSASISWAGGEAPVIYRNGEKYLYVNITYELAVGSRGATYSDFVNGNNRIKDYNLYNKYMVHCYEIGKLAAKDGEVEYYIVLKCNGYEYKSNVLKLTLATCSHPEDSFSYENDGLVICGICDALIEAEVVDADGKSLGYADIESAIKLAQENEGSTVKLMSEGVSESITVTGGRFTVDFNGKKVFYQFDVNGGDVTFTSSVKQADVETLISGITVNGTDAKVTIDGKIKLGSVTLTSGALSVNSTDGYIKELSINGGKAVIDGARIGALNTYGGEAVINDVNADSLTMCDNRSGGSEYNISIVSGRFGSFTCENGSNYTLGRAIASGSVVSADSMNGITVYTYEAIQTMTSTYRIFVDKCNHKDKNGSYVLDGNPCPYCNEEIVATVSYTAGGSEETDLFSDIYDAFAKANEIGTATVTLYKDITDDITDTIAVTGNVTLELNGKKLSTSGFDPYYAIEVKSGKLTVNGSGTIKCVVVRNGGDAEINGGIFSDFRIEDGGNAVINGGKFNSIKVSGEGRNVGQLLADGHAYKNFDGFWSTVAEREKQDIANVEVKEAPIKSATITANDESPIIYRNGKKASTFAADVTYSGNETLYITGCLIDGTVISEKTELLNGYCYLLGDQVDKVVAEDGEIQYYCIFTYDGYDYKSNVVTLTVATCRHPGESVKCDDNGNVCGICNRALTASVELSDGTLSYYGNWNDAISAAQESEGCTLKLLNYSWLKDNETFDISKGRFTVDLNKNNSSGSFAFNVKGGDITFTALKKASISFTGVTVSGENANVLIDSKATLNYLVVNSGKVTVDGAYISTITIKGGDMVINDVDTGLLSEEGNGSVNISIVSGRFENVVFDEYTFGKAIASGSRIRLTDADGGKIYKYADIQNKGNAGVIVVEKCDHKDENDSYALDGNPCPYCNEEIVATVSYTADGSEQTDLFSDIYDAFERANEVGTATVTLYKDIENSELTRYITVTGNVTLALNGKKLGYSFVSLTIVVSNGGMLTVDGDGKMMVPIIVNENAKLAVNGGEIATVMIYKDGDAVIGGGFIEDLVVNGNAKLSGGKFYNIEIANGSLESILADGYAYKKDGGVWLSIAERAESVYSSVNNDNKPVNVEEAPIKSATLSTEINKLYRNSNANPTVKFNPALAHGSNLNDSYVSKRYGINSYVSGDIIYSSLSALVKDAKLSADEIIDKAGDSDVAEIYYVVTTGDGYEIKSNTVSIDLVDCDHSQVVDPTADKETAGNITTPTYCEICESKFNAKITKGDDVRYYNDLDEAAKDAQKSENEGCTLYPLYNKNGYGGQLVITEGNFTLKYAVRTAFSRPIIINGKAKLTVTGRCAVTAFENQDAFIVQGGDVTFDGLATGSNVTINGGNVTMASNNINCLTINGGNVSISSGGFAEIITTVSDKVIADYIDPDFWVQDRGTKEWIDIYSLNKATASSTSGLTVRVCPMQIIQPRNNVYYTNGYYPGDIPSLQISAEPWYSNEVDAKVAYQWIAIDENGNETEIEGATDRKLSLENLTTGRYYCRITYSNATTAGVSMASDVVTATITECEHSGGEATCTNKAKCEICGAEYGETKPHSYAQIKSPEYLKSAATCTAKAVYYTSCTECGRSSKGTKNEATFEYGNALGHKYGEWVSNGDGTHSRVCANDSTHIETKACHGGKATCTAKAICEDCGKAYGEMAAHTFTAKTVAAKYLKSAATCTAKAVYYTSCADCGLSSKGTKNEATFEYGNALGHKYGEWVSNGNGTHTRVCANDNKHTETKNCHGGKATCTAKAICEDCGKAYGEMAAHTFTAKSTVSRYLKRAATCTEKSEYYVSCAGCGLSSKGTASEAVFTGSALGHSLTEWSVITEVTCTTNGTQERHCTRCDYKQTRTVVAKGHSYGLWNVTKKVGCITDGEQSRECSVCGNKETKAIAATGVHSYGSWKVAKAATCTTTGTKVRSCSECGAKETVIIQPTGHKYVESTVKPTYTEKGYTLHKCSECGTSYKSSYTDKLVLASVSGVKLAGRAADALRVSWNRNTSADGYIVEIYKDGAWARAGKITTDSTTDFKVTGLKASTFYKFRVKAYKMSGNTAVYSDYGTTLTARTNPSVITGAKLAGRAADALRISWDRNTSADGYIIEIYKDGAWSRAVKTTNNSITTYRAEGLKASTVYKLRVRAYKMDGTAAYYGNYSAEVTARTNPSVIKGAKLAGRAADALRISWNRNTSADGYIVEVYKDGAWARAGKITTDSTTDFRVTGLKASTVYKLRVRAYKMSGTAAYYGNYSAEVTARTNPSVMTGVKIGGTAKDALRINWSKNTSAQGYIVEMAQNGEWVRVAKITDNSTTTFRKAGLAKNTSYRFRVCAYHMSGSTPLYGTYVSVSGKTAAN